jgi:hypothetical protein
VYGPPVLWDTSTKGQKECHFRGVDCAATTDRDNAIGIQWRKECRSRNDIRLAWILINRRIDSQAASTGKRIQCIANVVSVNQIWINKQSQ